MPRTARVIVPYTPHHIIQRGHNRNAVFAHAADCHFYLDSLRELKVEFDVDVFAYCLMTNHVHLILQVGDDVSAIGQLMKRLSARQTRYVNKIEGRTGTLWESRFRSSPIETDRYLLACCRYVELNPVRAGLVSAPEHYDWSSYRGKVGLSKQAWIDLDPAYLGLGAGENQRIFRYREFISQGTGRSEQALIRAAIQRGQLTGGTRFVDEVERKLQRRVEHRGPGRPQKEK